MTSDRGVFCEPKPSIDSRIVGEDASDEAELGNREWARTETVGVVCAEESSSDGVDEVERYSPCPVGAGSDVSILFSFTLSSTN